MLRAAWCCAAMLACGGQAHGQVSEMGIADLTWLHLDDPDATRVGVVLAWPVGAVHDPRGRTGVAQTVRAMLELSQRHLPPPARFVVESHDGFTVLWSTVSTKDLPARLAFLARVLGGRLEVGDDLYALALARARLRADDNTRLYPGPALHNKACGVLFPGAPRGRQLAGIPREIAAITKAELRGRYRAHYGTRRALLATVGGTRQQVEAHLREHLTAATGVDQPPVPVKPAAAPPVVRSEIHPRVDGPYVSLALPADRSAAFLVAVGAMRHQAYAWFGKQRGKEWAAGFQFVRHQWLTGDPVVMINRRGRRAGSAADVREEILGFLGSIRGRGLRAKHVEMARQEITNTLERPWKGGRREVVFRARILCLRRLLGFDDAFLAQVAKVQVEEARNVLREYLREDRGCWLEFLPDPDLVVRGFSARR